MCMSLHWYMPNESILPHGKLLWALLMTEDEIGLTALEKKWIAMLTHLMQGL